jgi:hypothetical protein
MATVRDTAYVEVNGEFTRVELIDCGAFRWEVAFFKQHKQTANFDFVKVDEHSSEDQARNNFRKYKQQEYDGFISMFTNGDYTTRICRNWRGGFDAIVTDIRVKDGVKRTQVDMTVDETIRYLANAANRS